MTNGKPALQVFLLDYLPAEAPLLHARSIFIKGNNDDIGRIGGHDVGDPSLHIVNRALL